jgi:hypothetical protein
MVVVAAEKYRGRAAEDGDTVGRTVSYIVTGTDSESVALAELSSTAPGIWSGLEKVREAVEQIGTNEWEGTVEYSDQSSVITKPQTGSSIFDFQIVGTSQRVFQNLEGPTTYYPPIGPPPDLPVFDGAIGWNGNRFEGVDILVPQYAFSERHFVPDGTVTATYKALLATLVGTVNDSSFKGFAAGEVLFAGVRGSLRAELDWELSYDFIAQQNRTGLQIGDKTGIAKAGWDYIHVFYEMQDDDDVKMLLPKVLRVYVEQIYPRGDFSDIGIGV